MAPFALLAITFAQSSHAVDTVFMLGGSDGQTSSEKSIFLRDFSRFASAMQSRGWNSREYFGKGGSDLTGALPATLTNVHQMLTDAGNTRSGQVLFAIFAHGSKRREPERTHSIGLEDGEFSLDEFATVIERLKNRRVRVALIDFSCYSGNTLALATNEQNMCVVVGALKNYVGAFSANESILDESFFSASFSHFSDAAPISLQDHFDRARVLDRTNFPQISSVALPWAAAFDYVSRVFDPRSEGRVSKLAGRKPHEVQSVLEDYREDVFHKLTAGLAGAANESELNVLKIIVDKYVDAHRELTKVVLQFRIVSGDRMEAGYAFDRNSSSTQVTQGDFAEQIVRDRLPYGG